MKLTSNKRFYTQCFLESISKNENKLKKINIFNQKIEKSDIATEKNSCLCGCDSSSLDTIGMVDKFGFVSNSKICPKCGLVQLSPRMTEEEYVNFYKKDYRLIFEGEDISKYDKTTVINNSKNIEKRVDFVKKNMNYSDIDKVLEVGCGMGVNLYPYYKDGKISVGYDYGERFVELGCEVGMDLRLGSIDFEKESSNRYDLIILSHVLEHLLKPIDMMKNLSGLLNENGMLFIEIPDIDFFSIEQLEIPHTYYFTKNTLFYYAEKANLYPVAYDYGLVGNRSHLTVLFTKNIQYKQVINIENEYMKMRKKIKKYDRKMILKDIFIFFKIIKQ